MIDRRESPRFTEKKRTGLPETEKSGAHNMEHRTFDAIYRFRGMGRRALSLLLACAMVIWLAAPALSIRIAVVTTE